MSGLEGQQPALPITRVTLYTSGVGYFERTRKVDGDATETLFFPIEQINDVLKSLVLLDSGSGEIHPVTYAAQDPVSKELKAFSIDIGDNPTRGGLLNRIRGANVTVTLDSAISKEKRSGVVLGVEEQSIILPDRLGSMRKEKLNLVTSDGLASLLLDSIVHIQIEDTKLDAELRQALTVVAQGRDATKRPLTLSFSGQGKRDVLVGYLTEAPAWQTTYRLVLGEKTVLQGWALVQNTGQDDWGDVRLNLVAGRPISFIQDLYSPLYVHRPVVQSRIPASPKPQAYQAEIDHDAETLGDHPVPAGGAPPAPSSRGRSLHRGSELSAAMPANLLSLAGAAHNEDDEALREMGSALSSVAMAGAQLGQSHFVYNIQVPVSVPRQQSAMIPFLSAEIEAERVCVYNRYVYTDHPLTGVRLKNATGLHLMGGPLTVFSERSDGENGYVGDALIDDTEPDQTRLITYAVDLAVDASTDFSQRPKEIASYAIANGNLSFTQRYAQETVYTFKNHGHDPRTVIVEHLDSGLDWKITQPSNPAERTAETWRFELTVAAGSTEKLTVREEMIQESVLAILSIKPNSLINLLQTGRPSEAIRAALEEAGRRRKAVIDLKEEIADRDVRLNSISTGQERIRKNMEHLDHGSDLYKRYVGELDEQETLIHDLEAEKIRLREELARAEAELDDYVAGLKL